MYVNCLKHHIVWFYVCDIVHNKIVTLIYLTQIFVCNYN